MTRRLAVLLAFSCLADTVWARQPVRARNAIVVTEEPLAADVGAAVLKSGGNAIDAAVAVALALAVTYPVAGNIGGGGFLLARFADGKTTFIDFRERAPRAATRNMYLDPQGQPTNDSIEGWRASGVPGTVRGLALAHRKYGSKPWRQLVQPAIRLARDGFPAHYGFVLDSESSRQRFAKFPASTESSASRWKSGTDSDSRILHALSCESPATQRFLHGDHRSKDWRKRWRTAAATSHCRFESV
jgi:gamma-glutamyltranspeptidase/glutathione hydrolase